MDKSKKVKFDKRIIQRVIHVDALRSSSMLAYLHEPVKRNNPRNPRQFAPKKTTRI